MTDELFPIESVTMDSPRRAWIKRHGLTTWHTTGLRGDEEDDFGNAVAPWTCAHPEDIASGRSARWGSGNTEDEACAAYAQKHGIPLWNEEGHAPKGAGQG